MEEKFTTFLKGIADTLITFTPYDMVGKWRFEGETEDAFGTPGGSHQGKKGFVFSAEEYKFILRAIDGIIAIESYNLSGQLYNADLRNNKVFEADNEYYFFKESYAMTVGYGRKSIEEVTRTFKTLGYSDDVICKINIKNPNWHECIEKILDWAIARENVKKYLKENVNIIDSIIRAEKVNKYPLNQIRYGPPGTGKTYNTINRALEIIGFDLKGKSRSEIKDEFDKYVKSGQIVFTTFHQSMSYEDFIEGIKPETNDKGKVIYEVKDGIFKKICKEAEKKKKIQITQNEMVEELTIQKFNDYYKEFADNLPDINQTSSNVTLKTKEGYEFSLFRNSAGSISVKAGAQQVPQSISLNELTRVLFEGKKPNYQSYENIILDEILKDKNKQEIDSNEVPYVLIIDEINRGNVSAIFGELITLIEDSKRLGKDEALTVILPYSKEPFGVPPNLYIIGTMNTADRSVEALDTALRRRFVFEEMMPNYELLTDKKIDDISLKTILETINNRIEVLLSRDHLIGHSYFLEVDSWEKLQETFYKNIIPLLQEYFYGDYGKIGLVLGSGFVKKKNIATPFAKVDDYDYDFERNVFEIIKNNTETIKNAINKLLNINDNAQA